jgi:hypothetical protein
MTGDTVLGPVTRAHLTIAEERLDRGVLLAGTHVLSGGRLVLRGQLGGSSRVDSGGQLTVDGQLTGTLVVAQDARVELTGQIGGVIRNAGWVRMSGAISARVLQNTGLVEFAAGSVINRGGRFVRLCPDGTFEAFRSGAKPSALEPSCWLTLAPGCRFVPPADLAPAAAVG